MARGRRGVAGVQAERGIVRGTHTRRVPGLGRSVRPNGRRPASAFVYGSLASCRRGRAWPYPRRRARGRSGSKQLQVPYFELNFLNFSKQNCTKG
jgi:hypothetical protein